MVNALWLDDSLQFPRLLAELNAGGFLQGPTEGDETSESRWSNLCESMNLSPDEIEELIERAERRWEWIKAHLPDLEKSRDWNAEAHVPHGSGDATYRVVRLNGEVVAIVDPDDVDSHPLGLAQLIARVPETDMSLRDFVNTIENTGGVVRNAKGVHAPVDDPDWIDLGEAYILACDAIGRDPMVVVDD